MFASTEAGVLHSHAGAPFTLSTTGMAYSTLVSRIVVAPDGTLIAPGRMVWGSSDRGVTWSLLVSMSSLDVYNSEVAIVVGDRAFVGTDGGRIHRADPPYTTWQADTPVPNRRIHALAAVDGELYIGARDGVYRSLDEGATASATDLTGVACGGVAALADGGVVAACTNGIWITDSGRTAFTQVLAGVDMHELVILDDGRILALGFYDGVVISADRGNTWTPVSTPTGVQLESAIIDRSDGSLVLGTAGHGLVRVALP